MEEKAYEAMSREEIEGLTLGEVMNLPFEFDTMPRNRPAIELDIYATWELLNEAIKREFPEVGTGKSSISIPAAMASIIVKHLMDGRLTKLLDGQRESPAQGPQG